MEIQGSVDDNSRTTSKSLVYSDFTKLADKYEYFLFDCDGVLWLGAESIAGSFETLSYLMKKGK